MRDCTAPLNMRLHCDSLPCVCPGGPTSGVARNLLGRRLKAKVRSRAHLEYVLYCAIYCMGHMQYLQYGLVPILYYELYTWNIYCRSRLVRDGQADINNPGAKDEIAGFWEIVFGICLVSFLEPFLLPYVSSVFHHLYGVWSLIVGAMEYTTCINKFHISAYHISKISKRCLGLRIHWEPLTTSCGFPQGPHIQSGALRKAFTGDFFVCL